MTRSLGALMRGLSTLRSLEERKQTVISSIESQGKLTDELLAKLEQAETVVAVEDIYRRTSQRDVLVR